MPVALLRIVLITALAVLATTPSVPAVQARGLDLPASLAPEKDPGYDLAGLSGPVAILATQQRRGVISLSSAAAKLGLSFKDGLVRVVIHAKRPDQAGQVAAMVQNLGGHVAARYNRWIDAWLPPKRLEQAAGHAAVLLVRKPFDIRPIDQPRKQGLAHRSAWSGSYTTQGVAVSGADAWHAAGHVGQGVKLAVIDSFKGYGAAQTLGDLPKNLSIHGKLDLGSPHGTACAEIVYDMAPGVDLTLSSPDTSEVAMAQAVVELAELGNKVISSSIGSVFFGSGDGTDALSLAVSQVFQQHGTLFCQANGNNQTGHWDGIFRDDDGDNWHEFAPGVEINALNKHRPFNAGNLINIELRWNDWPASDQDYDLYLFFWKNGGWALFDSSQNWQTGSQTPTEHINSVAPFNGTWGFAIRKHNARGDAILDINGYNTPALSINQPLRSLIDPAAGPHTLAVAAADAGSLFLEPYSSWGPTRGPGGGLAGGRDNPQITGYANVDTVAYGPNGFNGTSAATPHVAGAAALVWEAFPHFTPQEVWEFLASRALPQGDGDYNYQYGHGRLWLGQTP